MEREIVSADSLDFVMNFGHVIQVHENGTVSDGIDVMPPVLFMEVDADGQSIHADDADLKDQAAAAGWSLLTGFSGQDCYHGPVMHPSEYIGGRIADAILENPGYYVNLVVERQGPEIDEDGNEDELDPAGWAVAYREA